MFFLWTQMLFLTKTVLIISEVDYKVKIVTFFESYIMFKNILAQNNPLLALVDTSSDSAIFHSSVYT